MNAIRIALILSTCCCVCARAATATEFVRGDANGEGVVDVSDPVAVLLHLFAGRSVACPDAADFDDDGRLDVTDGVAGLQYLFARSAPPAAPFPECGADPTDDDLTCEAHEPCPPRDPTVSIAVFNVENFDQGEFAKEHVARAVARVVREFDLIVIQEIRDPGQVVPNLLLDRVNAAPGPPYDMVEGPPVGGEQYAVYYKRELFELLGAHTHPDPAGDFLRSVLVTSFRAGQFDFTLLSLHANHIGTAAELAALAAACDATLEAGAPERDVVLLGDLNADCGSFDVRTADHPLRDSRFHWVIPDSADTNVPAAQDCARDRIILLDSTRDSEYVRDSAAVFRFDVEFGLEPSVARDVSDHYPVFARFDTSAIDDD